MICAHFTLRLHTINIRKPFARISQEYISCDQMYSSDEQNIKCAIAPVLTYDGS